MGRAKVRKAGRETVGRKEKESGRETGSKLERDNAS